MIINNSYPNVNFQGRCPQIKDAQWVIHTIHTQAPHFCASKFQPLFIKFIQSKPHIISNIQEITTNEHICTKILPEDIQIKNLNKLSLPRKIFEYIKKIIQGNQRDLDIKKIHYIIKKIHSVEGARIFCYGHVRGNDNVHNILNIIKGFHLGNCSEEAKLAELILRLNGIKNARTAILTSGGKEVDHLVCIFNRDGTRFHGKINNSTIIIDPWAQKADFAKNLLKYYQNTMYKFLNLIRPSKNIDPDKSIGLKKHKRLAISEKDLQILKELYPEFIFKNKSHEFMQK